LHWVAVNVLSPTFCGAGVAVKGWPTSSFGAPPIASPSGVTAGLASGFASGLASAGLASGVSLALTGAGVAGPASFLEQPETMRTNRPRGVARRCIKRIAIVFLLLRIQVRVR